MLFTGIFSMGFALVKLGLKGLGLWWTVTKLLLNAVLWLLKCLKFFRIF